MGAKVELAWYSLHSADRLELTTGTRNRRDMVASSAVLALCKSREVLPFTAALERRKSDDRRFPLGISNFKFKLWRCSYLRGTVS